MRKRGDDHDFRLDRRTALQMLGLGAAERAGRRNCVRARRRTASPSAGRAMCRHGTEPAVRAGRAADLQAGVRPAARPERRAELIPKLITKWDLARRPSWRSSCATTSRSTTAKDDAEDFRYTSSSASRPATRSTRDSWRKVTDIEVRRPAGRRSISTRQRPPRRVARLPRQLQGVEGIGGRGRLDAFRERPVDTGPYKLVNTSSIRASCRAQRPVFGPSRSSSASPSISSRTFGARRRDPVRPGRPHHRRAGARGRAPEARAEPEGESTRSPA